MNIRQLIQTAPAKANELLARIADTSPGAAKTRTKLVSELKQELEAISKLEEQHLFPVLRKHKETKDLVAGAMNDNKQTLALVAELEATPAESDEFARRAAELRKVFQQHVRDDRKELLPAVVKALSDEEAQQVVDKVEREKAEAEEAARAEAERRRTEARRERERAEAEQARHAEEERRAAEERRAEARREREQEEAVRRTVQGVADTVRAGAEGSRQVAESARAAVQTGAETMSRASREGTQRMGEVFATAARESQRRMRDAATGFEVIAEANAALSARYRDIWREWIGYVQSAAREGQEGVARVAAARTPQALLDAQLDLFRREVGLLLESNAKISHLAQEGCLAAKQRLEERDAEPEREKRRRA